MHDKKIDTSVILGTCTKCYHPITEGHQCPEPASSLSLKALAEGFTKYQYIGCDPRLLEKFDNPFNQNLDASVKIVAPEFTSLCPITKQPDFAAIRVEYVPIDYCVESKSFKLYLGTFRQEGMFHEACVNKICMDLVELLKPKYITVVGEFAPRGGIKFWPTASWQP